MGAEESRPETGANSLFPQFAESDSPQIDTKIGSGTNGAVHRTVPRKKGGLPLAMKVSSGAPNTALMDKYGFMAHTLVEVAIMNMKISTRVLESCDVWFGKDWSLKLTMPIMFSDASRLPGKKPPSAKVLTRSKDEVLIFLIDGLRGLRDLHASGVVHGDIKLANILADIEDKQLKFVLADFGLSCIELSSRPCRGSCCSPISMSPEVLTSELDSPTRDKQFGTKLDVWALAVATIEFATGWRAFPILREKTKPAAHMNRDEQLSRILVGIHHLVRGDMVPNMIKAGVSNKSKRKSLLKALKRGSVAKIATEQAKRTRSIIESLGHDMGSRFLTTLVAMLTVDPMVRPSANCALESVLGRNEPCERYQCVWSRLPFPGDPPLPLVSPQRINELYNLSIAMAGDNEMGRSSEVCSTFELALSMMHRCLAAVDGVSTLRAEQTLVRVCVNIAYKLVFRQAHRNPPKFGHQIGAGHNSYAVTAVSAERMVLELLRFDIVRPTTFMILKSIAGAENATRACTIILRVAKLSGYNLYILQSRGPILTALAAWAVVGHMEESVSIRTKAHRVLVDLSDVDGGGHIPTEHDVRHVATKFEELIDVG